MVLDGALNPDLTNNELDLEQAESFEVDLHDFFNVVRHELDVRVGASWRRRRRLPAADVEFAERHDAPCPSSSPAFGGNQTVDYGGRGDRRARISLLDGRTGRNWPRRSSRRSRGDGIDPRRDRAQLRRVPAERVTREHRGVQHRRQLP